MSRINFGSRMARNSKLRPQKVEPGCVGFVPKVWILFPLIPLLGSSCPCSLVLVGLGNIISGQLLGLISLYYTV